ncbi:glycoside hydrolase family 19 protein [Sphingomonas sp. MMS24-J13]|uniref:glycoside hydrolase family 19 protein n=1 Tax=Sphingomonas sp. MMS24-J13 TaxID=3238686 RepID=UPI00384E7F12
MAGLGAIDWPTVQTRIGASPDGYPGPITYGLLVDIVGSKCDAVAKCLTEHAGAYGMTTPGRLAEFLAQIANETGGFVRWDENLNYSVTGMVKTWPTHFTQTKALECYGHPDLIAECAYGGRMGNGPEGSGDGWKYRGRGALQLTGKAAYTKFGQILGLNLVADPDLAADPFDSTLIALEYFKELKVNDAVDQGDFTKARQLTNGGTIGLENVALLRQKLLAVLT